MRIQWLTILAGIACAGLLGCGADEGSDDDKTAAQKTTPPTVGAPSDDPNVTLEEARQGLGAKSKQLEQEHVDPRIAAPAKALFAVEEQVALGGVRKALELYRATHGHYPKSHEEFQKEIIDANQGRIRLPQLPPGERYVWDPQRGKLMVERPVRQ